MIAIHKMHYFQDNVSSSCTRSLFSVRRLSAGEKAKPNGLF